MNVDCVLLDINSIRKDGGTQPRQKLNSGVVREYSEAMKAGAQFPPVDVFYDGSDYWLADGFHRVRAAFAAERQQLEATVHQGTLADAQWFSFGANATNGLYRSNEDKQRAIQSALKHPKSQGLSDQQIARHVGVDPKTVATWRERISGNSRDGVRTATRNGKTYDIDVTNIGHKTETKTAQSSTNKKKQAKPAVGTGRRATLDNCHKERLAKSLGCIDGAIYVMNSLDYEYVRGGCSDSDLANFYRMARNLAAELRGIVKRIKGVMDETATPDRNEENCREGFTDSPDGAAGTGSVEVEETCRVA